MENGEEDQEILPFTLLATSKSSPEAKYIKSSPTDASTRRKCPRERGKKRKHGNKMSMCLNNERRIPFILFDGFLFSADH